MRYAYHNIGKQPAGTTAIVRWRGSAADVLLLDPVNFSRYCEGRRPVFFSGGGHYRHPPARLSIPQDGRWYVVADLGGYAGNAKATVEVSQRHDGDPRAKRQEALVEV